MFLVTAATRFGIIAGTLDLRDPAQKAVYETKKANGTLTVEEAGALELLDDVFGHTVNTAGFKELDSHVGLIYGDSITVERAREINARLEAKGYATTNVVYGVGSFSFQFKTSVRFL